jgi:HEAT repeat protein
MPTPVETRVLRLLTAIDADPTDVARTVLELGTPAVTVLCDVALATFPGMRQKVRTNAVALLGWVEHPQANETLRLLVADPDPDVASRAMRAVGRRLDAAVPNIATVLGREETEPRVAAEAVKALRGLESAQANGALARYVDGEGAPSHRRSTVVQQVIGRLV